MKVICAWCERDGQPALIGERAPLFDERPTHGICRLHLEGYLQACEVPSSSIPGEPFLADACGHSDGHREGVQVPGLLSVAGAWYRQLRRGVGAYFETLGLRVKSAMPLAGRHTASS